MKLYHTTLKSNLENILQKGLIASKIGIVYLSEKPNSWWQREDYITLEIDMTDLKNKLITFNNPDLDEILCWGNIEPSRIKVLGKGYINENGRRNQRGIELSNQARFFRLLFKCGNKSCKNSFC